MWPVTQTKRSPYSVDAHIGQAGNIFGTHTMTAPRSIHGLIVYSCPESAFHSTLLESVIVLLQLSSSN